VPRPFLSVCSTSVYSSVSFYYSHHRLGAFCVFSSRYTTSRCFCTVGGEGCASPPVRIKRSFTVLFVYGVTTLSFLFRDLFVCSSRLSSSPRIGYFVFFAFIFFALTTLPFLFLVFFPNNIRFFLALLIFVCTTLFVRSVASRPRVIDSHTGLSHVEKYCIYSRAQFFVF